MLKHHVIIYIYHLNITLSFNLLILFHSIGKSEKLYNLLSQVPEKFKKLLSEQGVIIATQIMVSGILIEPIRKRSEDIVL